MKKSYNIIGITLLTLSLQFPVVAQSPDSAVSRINKMETSFYGRAHDQDDLNKRISRLENNIFGKSSFDSTHDRLDRLERAIGNENSYKIENTRPASQIKTSGLSAGPNANQKFANLLTKAQADISLKRFNSAADELMDAVEMNPKSSLAFRQLGDVLVELKDFEGAQEAYKACMDIDQSGENGKYAKLKLQAFFARTNRFRAPVSRVVPTTPKNTLSTIDSQINEYKEKMDKEGQKGAAWKTQSTIRETQRINEDTQQWLRDSQTYSTSGGLPFGSSRRGSSRGGSTWSSTSSSSTSNSRSSSRNGIIEQGRLRSNFVNADGQNQSTNALFEASERARHFDESANNLKDQLGKKKMKGDVELQQFGTNVYVRNYGSSSASKSDEKSQQVKP
ncbi:MAG: hypothetical protein KIT34_01220 [Cyanobacteria bacterium TGS_CYA1]|nr:hypothetical protein [Cyanobacteria bacterium TGS_CYA1]